MTRLLVLAFLLVGAQAAAQTPHPCAEDALSRTEALIRFHWGESDMPGFDLDDAVTEIAPVRALQGSGQFDVLETWGYIYRASYRTRFIYARFPGSCILMGQEIIENSDPY